MKLVQKHPILTLLFLSLFLFLVGNELLPITDTAESNYALTSKEMVLSGDWISPQIYGNYWYDKPIFYYWLLSASFSAFGFNEFAARLPSALFGTLNVLFIYWFTGKVFSKKAALPASLIFLSSLETWYLSKAVITDSTLFFFMSASVAFFYLGYRENRNYYYLCYVFAGLATLTKGPIGILLPGLACFLFLIYQKNRKEILRAKLFTGLLLFLAVTLPWYGMMTAIHGKDVLLNFLGVHNFLRATVSEHPSQNKWYYYLLIYLAGFFPYSFVLPISLYKKWKSKALDLRAAGEGVHLLVIYGFTVFLFFQLIATKYTTYTFPTLFPLAVLSGVLFAEKPWVPKVAISMILIFASLTLFLAPTIMMNRSGKEVGLALAKLPTDGKIIASFGEYRTSSVFYSGKTIYRAVPGNQIQDMKPGGLSWNAKNVMPFVANEKVIGNQNAILISQEGRDQELINMHKHLVKTDTISVPGKYDIIVSD